MDFAVQYSKVGEGDYMIRLHDLPDGFEYTISECTIHPSNGDGGYVVIDNSCQFAIASGTLEECESFLGPVQVVAGRDLMSDLGFKYLVD